MLDPCQRRSKTDPQSTPGGQFSRGVDNPCLATNQAIDCNSDLALELLHHQAATAHRTVLDHARALLQSTVAADDGV